MFLAEPACGGPARDFAFGLGFRFLQSGSG
jgi:hypothetical protein